MSLKIDAAIYGAKELENALNELPKSMSKSALRTALTKSAQPVVEAAKRYVPVDTGELRDSITTGTKLTKNQRRFQLKVGGAQIFIGASWPKGAHAHLVEFGFMLTGHEPSKVRIRHIPAQPFLRPAWDENKDQVLARIGGELWKALLKKARTLARKGAKGTLSKRTIEELRA